MNILDEYQNLGQSEDEDSQNIDPEMARKKRAEFERNVVILNSDLKKVLREIEDMEIQRRRFKKEEQRIRIERDQLDIKLKKLQNDRDFLEEEIQGIKKKLKVLM